MNASIESIGAEPETASPVALRELDEPPTPRIELRQNPRLLLDGYEYGIPDSALND